MERLGSHSCPFSPYVRFNSQRKQLSRIFCGLGKEKEKACLKAQYHSKPARGFIPGFPCGQASRKYKLEAFCPQKLSPDHRVHGI
jgi:hypothetical protein